MQGNDEGRNRNKRYEVQFQKDGQFHSDTDDLPKAKLYARSLANWNLAAQIYDRVTHRIIFRAQAYAEKRRSLDVLEAGGSIG